MSPAHYNIIHGKTAQELNEMLQNIDLQKIELLAGKPELPYYPWLPHGGISGYSGISGVLPTGINNYSGIVKTTKINFGEWMKRIRNNSWLDTLPADLQEKVKKLRTGCNCDRAKGLRELLPTLLKYAPSN